MLWIRRFVWNADDKKFPFLLDGKPKDGWRSIFKKKFSRKTKFTFLTYWYKLQPCNISFDSFNLPSAVTFPVVFVVDSLSYSMTREGGGVRHPTLESREYWMFSRGPGLVAVEWLAPRLPPFLHRQLAGWETHRKTEKERQLAEGMRGCWPVGVGEEPNYTTAKKPDPLQIIQYSLSYGCASSDFKRTANPSGEGGGGGGTRIITRLRWQDGDIWTEK
jgi:hypothetical protein